MRGLYESMRSDHGFRMLDYSIDSDAASPRACFQFSESLPAKRTDFSPFVAVAGIDKPALSAEQKQLCVEGLKHGERYSVTLRSGLPSTVQETLAKSVGGFDLRARSHAAGAFLRQGLRAAPRRPARHSRSHRQHQGGEHRDLSHRRPQPARHGAGQRVPAQPRRLRRRAACREQGRQRVEGRARRRADAQRRSDDRIPGRSGGRRSCARCLCDDRDPGRLEAGAPLRQPRDAMVHRVRPRPCVVLGQRRHQRVRQFAGDDRAEGAGRSPPDRAQQRSPCHQAQRRGRPRDVRSGPDARRGRARSGHAGCRGEGRLRVPQPEGSRVRSLRPRRVGPHGAGRARCLRLHRARRLSLRRDGAHHRSACATARARRRSICR